MTRRQILLLLSGVLVTAGACASSGASSRRGGSDRNTLTQEEIATVRVANAYEAVERLRPRWLQIRAPKSLQDPTEVVVFLNNSYLGGPDVLRQFASTSITRLRYLDGSTASATLNGLGGRSVEGAIIVEVS